MKNLALITLILLLLMLFTTISKLFSGNCFNTNRIVNDLYEIKKPGCFIVLSSFKTPDECNCDHVQKNSQERNSSSGLFQHSGNTFIMESSSQNKKPKNLHEFHNTSEATIGYFFIQ